MLFRSNLEKLKLVKRVASKDDRRKNLIYLTAEAQQLQEQSMELANQTLNESLDGVTNSQIEIAKEVLNKVYINLAPSNSTEVEGFRKPSK